MSKTLVSIAIPFTFASQGKYDVTLERKTVTISVSYVQNNKAMDEVTGMTTMGTVTLMPDDPEGVVNISKVLLEFPFLFTTDDSSKDKGLEVTPLAEDNWLSDITKSSINYLNRLAGLVNQLFEKEPKYLLIDEIDKMGGNDQVSLLHLMETGIISETKVKKTRQVELVAWVIATANSVEKIIEPLLSRFVVLQIPEYNFEEFSRISLAKLTEERVAEELAINITEKVWNELGSKDIRDVIKVGRLANDIQEVSLIVSMMKTPVT